MAYYGTVVIIVVIYLTETNSYSSTQYVKNVKHKWSVLMYRKASGTYNFTSAPPL